MARKYKSFYHGKGIPKNDKLAKPLQAESNTFVDTYDKKTGIFKSRRKYNSQGSAYRDLDAGHEHRPFDHVHDFSSKEDIHKKFRLPDKREEKEFKKAKRKRRFM